MKKGTAIFPGWLFPFVYCVAGVDAYTSSEELRCFFYFEDNLFAKEPNGDLSLLESSLHLFSP